MFQKILCTDMSRRGLIKIAGLGTLSAAALGVLSNDRAMAMAGSTKSMQSGGADVDILNVALGLEHEAIEAYQIGAESGLLSAGVLKVAVQFQSHHKGHRDALTNAIGTMGGKPIAPKTRADYVAALGVASLKSEADVLRLAAKLEKGAANAYLGVIPSFTDNGLAQVSARLAADETMHWTALAGALGEMLPAEALSFGA